MAKVNLLIKALATGTGPYIITVPAKSGYSSFSEDGRQYKITVDDNPPNAEASPVRWMVFAGTYNKTLQTISIDVILQSSAGKNIQPTCINSPLNLSSFPLTIPLKV